MTNEKWELVKLGDVVNINPENRSPVKENWDEIITYVDIDAVENATGKIVSPKILRFKEAPSRARRVIHKDDVLVSMVRPELKAFAYVPKELDNQICSTGFAVLRGKGLTNPLYLLNVMFSEQVISQFRKLTVGGQYPSLTQKTISQIVIPLPPLPEQQRIASILSAADKAIEEAGLAIEESERIKNGLMQKLFSSGSNNIGLCGTQAYLGDIADITTGKLDSNAAVTGGKYPFFTCSPETLAINDYAFDCEAVLLAGNNASGKFNVKYYSGKFNAYQRTYIIQPKKSDQMDCQYLKNILSLRLTEMERLSIGSTTRFLTRKILDKFVIPIPPLPEQKCIVNIISTADEQIVLSKKRKALLEKTKQGLMQQLLGGNN